jgi:phosphoglycerate dehydrogenase-like enzyme
LGTTVTAAEEQQHMTATPPTRPTILIEEDHFLKIVPVILDPETPPEHQQAIEDFFAHDVLDFVDWCAQLRARIPGLFPARVIWATSQRDLVAKLVEADGVIVESLAIDREALASAKRLKVAHKFGTLVSNIDQAACMERGIAVAVLHRRVNVAVAEQCFALMLALAKRVCTLDGLVERRALEKAGYSIRPRAPAFVGYSNFARVAGLKTLYGATLGMVGLGEVGREIAHRATTFGMHTLYFQRRRLDGAAEEALGARHASLDELMAQSDYIVTQLPLNDATRGIIDAKALKRVKPGAILINCARAELIDRGALIDALDAGRLGGLGLDVGYEEPADSDDPLLRYRGRGNVILMPHTAVGARENAQSDLERLCLNLWRAMVR